MARSKGKTACDDCGKKKIKCTHALFNSKRSADQIADAESKKVIVGSSPVKPRSHWRKRRTSKSKSPNSIHLNRNPTGINHHSKEKIRYEESTTPDTVLSFSIGKSELGSRLAKKNDFHEISLQTLLGTNSNQHPEG